MKRRILSIIISGMMILALFPVSVFADTNEGNEAKIGDTEYATLEEAIDAVQTNDEIFLLKDITREGKEPIQISNKFAIDFNGHSITVDKTMFQIDGYGWLILRNVEAIQTSDDNAYGFITDCSGMVELESTAGEGIRVKTSFIKNLKEGSGLNIDTATILSDNYVVENTEEHTGISIMDGVYTGKSGVEGQPSLKGAVFSNVKGELTINGGTYTGGWFCLGLEDGANCAISGNSSFTSYSDAIRAYVGSDLKIDNCKVEVTGVGYCVEADGGTVSIAAGTFTAENGGGVFASKGGKVSVQAEEDVLVQTKDPAVRIDSNGFVVINGGTYVSSGLEGQGSGCVEQNSGSITITGGDFTGRDAAFYIGEGVANFKGGTFTSQDLMGAALQMSGGEVDIESGTFVGKGGGQAFFMDSGAATVSGGKFISEDGIGIWNAKGVVYDPAQLTINDCTVNAKEVALYFSGTEDNEVNGGTYTSETTNALNVYQSGVVISSGIFTNAAGGAAIKDEQNGLTVAEGSAADPANWKETSASVVRISFPVASIGDKAYPSLEEAFAASKDGDTIVLLKDIVNYDRPAIEVNKKVTLDFNEHKITVNENMFQVNENASLTLKNADVQQIMTSDAFYVEYAFIKDCKGDLIIDSTAGGDIDLGEALINTLYSTGSITVNGGTVKSLQRVIKKVEAGAKVTINDGELIADNGKSGDYKNGVIISSCEGDFEMNGGKLSPAVTAMHIDEPGSVLLNGGVIESGVEGIYVEGDCKVEVNDIEINAPLGCLSVEGGELFVNNGTFNAKHGYAILVKNTENAVINNGTFQSNDKCVAVNDSTITFNDGKYSLTNPVTDDACECVVLYNSSANIKGGEFCADIVSTIVLYDSELVMDGGTIYSETNGIEVIGGQVTINKGTVDTSDGSECIFIAQYDDNPRDLNDKVIINGGNFKAGENRYCVWSKYGHIIVNDGTFQAGSACIFNETGENEINGGTFTSQNSAAVRMDNNANLTLTGGKFINESGEAALPDQENIVIADGYKADPEEWKEASVVEIIPDVREYVITEGADSKWKNGSKEGLKFRANGEYAKFIDVSVDGKTLKNSYYKAWSGSTYVELQPDYLKTLSVGKHSLKVQYTDGSAETVFTILDTNPDTADHSATTLWIVMALIFGTAVVVFGRKFVEKR